MTPDERQAVVALARCTFLPGSSHKRFARSLAAMDERTELSPKQREHLWRLTHHYRRQIQDWSVWGASVRRRDERRRWPATDARPTGGAEIAANTWGHFKGDEQRFQLWCVYEAHVKERLGLDLKAMNPDGTWRPWSPADLQR